jgi:hypothetical protein
MRGANTKLLPILIAPLLAALTGGWVSEKPTLWRAHMRLRLTDRTGSSLVWLLIVGSAHELVTFISG